MSKGSSISASSSSELGNVANNFFSCAGERIIPVESSTYQTVDFRNFSETSPVLFSTPLDACAVVLIKNKNSETGKYDNVVTLSHFYPANAYSSRKAHENLNKVFADFTAHGGVINSDTSVTLLGGGLLEGEDINDTTPLGPLLDVLEQMKRRDGFKFTHHKTSINDLRGSVDSNYPEKQGSMVFVNRDGTGIVGMSLRKSDNRAVHRLLTKEIGSLPLDKLVAIRMDYNGSYPTEVRDGLNRRQAAIDKMMEGESKPDLPVSSMEEVIGKILTAQRRNKESVTP